ncbi:MAG: class I SAM-dependent methyltransferase, partial [Thermomicrobiales bacterium]
HVCRVHPGTSALEIGSYRGHCALALALAGKQVTSIDVSDKYLESRQTLVTDHQQEERVSFLLRSSEEELLLPQTFDVILHDNGKRRSSLLTELEAFWTRKLSPGGLLMVHNVEHIDLPRLNRQLDPEGQIVTSDRRNRQLGFFVKPVR